MISYMGNFIQDAIDFWHGAKAARAVLRCEFERGTVYWDDTTRIDRKRRAHAQKHVNQFTNCESSINKPCKFCTFYQTGFCNQVNDHYVSGILHRHI